MYTAMPNFCKGSGGSRCTQSWLASARVLEGSRCTQPCLASTRVLKVQTLVSALHSLSFAEQAVTLTLSPIFVNRISTIVQPHEFVRNLNGCKLYIQQSAECKGRVYSVCCLPSGIHRRISVDQINALFGVSKT